MKGAQEAHECIRPTDINHTLSDKYTDQDFKYIITAEYYVPSLGGFSNLGGALNKNTVYWDLSEQLFNAYKSVLRDK